MAETKENLKNIITELIQTEMAILGVGLGLELARRVPGLQVEADGSVVLLDGNQKLVYQSLLEEYSSFSVQATELVKNALEKKYVVLAKI
jgi:anthranilate/para-aminobenzoate synthase component II